MRKLYSAFVALVLTIGFIDCAEANLTGPVCYQINSTTSKVQQYRLYFDSSSDGHYMIGGRAYVRTPTGLGTVVLSYPVSGGAYTVLGNQINASVSVFWINTGASGTAVLPFDAALSINGNSGEVVEQIGSVRVTYPFATITCGTLD